MPTGYTKGIIDGKIETFQDFAKQCMRAFGACIHMRDENIDEEYKPRTPNEYYVKALQEAKEKKRQAETSTDIELVNVYTKELFDRNNECIEHIEKAKIIKAKLEEFLAIAIAFKAPTPDHEGLRKFMIEQLQSTIEQDGTSEYYEKELAIVVVKLNNIDANQIRLSLIEDANENITYHLKEYEKELERCAYSNKWVSDLLKVLK